MRGAPLIAFEGPAKLDEEPGSVTLQPDERYVFEYMVAKSNLNLNYLWYLARVELSTSNLDVSREGQLQITE